MSSIEQLVRENIRRMKPYSSARHEFDGQAAIFLDANENSMGSPAGNGYNRYPDPLQSTLRKKLSAIKGVAGENIFIGNGSDEAIDLLQRIFCEPGKDNILLFPPTYGMYEVCAAVNDVEARKVPLTISFELDLDAIAAAIDDRTKMIFLCSPNNPTGNSLSYASVETILNNFDGIVVIDEAYINYSRQQSFTSLITEYPQLVVLQTLSKAWGLAALRIGMAFGSAALIGYMNKIKYPYNVGLPSQELAESALENVALVNTWIAETVGERERLAARLSAISCCRFVFPSDANFILVKMDNAEEIYQQLRERGIIVRNRSNVILCEDCLRITVGTVEENEALISALNDMT